MKYSSINRLRFWAAVFITSLVFCAQSWATDLWTGPYLTFINDPTTTVIINWVANNSNGTVTLSGSGLNPTTENAYGESMGSGKYTNHVAFDCLSPNSQYNYVIVHGNDTLAEQSFYSAKTSLEIGDILIIIGDTQDDSGSSPQTPTYHPDVVNAYMDYDLDDQPLFILQLGDQAQWPFPDDLFQEFIDPMVVCSSYHYDSLYENHVADTRPVLTTLGNHQVLDSTTTCENYKKLLELPRNNPSETELYYSFDYGQTHWSVLNTQAFRDTAAWGEEYRIEQTDWLEEDLMGTEEPYRFVMYHIPHIFNERSGVSSRDSLVSEMITEYWIPLFEEYKIQAVFSGHCHCYDYCKEDSINYIISGGGGPPCVNISSTCVDTQHYLRMEYRGDSIHVIPLDLDGNILQDTTSNDWDFYLYSDTSTFNYLAGSISGNLTENRYFVTGQCSVAMNDTLEIDPGTHIFFKGNYYVYVKGTLIADGTSSEPIVFKPKPNSGVEWSGIYVYDDSDGSCVFDHCEISGSQIGILAVRSDLTVSNCTIEDVMFGFIVHNSDLTLSDTYLEYTQYGLEDITIDANTITITNCSFVSDGNNSYAVRGYTAELDITTSSFLGVDNTDTLGLDINGGGLILTGHFPDCTYTVKNFQTGICCDDAEVYLEQYSPTSLRPIISNNIVFGIELYDCDDCSLFQTDFKNNGDDQSQSACGALYLYNSTPHLRKNYFDDNDGFCVYAEELSDAVFGCYASSANGNEFNNQNSPVITPYGIIYETGDSYPLFNSRYNNFYRDETGYDFYIYNEDLEDVETVRIIENNFWDDSNGPEYTEFYPEDASKWDWDPYCGSPNNIYGEGSDNGNGSGEYLSLDSGDGLEDGLAYEEAGDYQSAVDAYTEFIAETDNAARKIVAMRRLLRATVRGGLNIPPLLGYYQSIASTSRSNAVSRAADLLTIKVKEAMGDYHSAVLDYEAILLNNPSFQDSVYSVISAGRAYLMMSLRSPVPPNWFNPRIPQLKPNNYGEYRARRAELLSQLHNMRGGELAGVENGGGLELLPRVFALHQNYPNPFNPVTEIRYDLPEISQVKIEVFNILGRKVCTLVDGVENAGFRKAIWKGIDGAGVSLSSGLYIYRIKAEGLETGEEFSLSRKMMLLQ